MSGKRQRQAAIRELLVGSTGSTQEQIKDELERRGLGTALITLCVGGGMGIAGIIERVN